MERPANSDQAHAAEAAAVNDTTNVAPESSPAPPQEPTTDNNTSNNNTPTNPPPMSKKAQKRALKEAKWEACKEQRDAKRKEKRLELKLIRKQKIEEGLIPHRPRVAPGQVITSIGIVIDLDFEDKMKEAETRSTAQQISRCYSANKHSPTAVHMHLTSFTGLIKQALSRSDPNHTNWATSKCPAEFHAEDLMTAFPAARENVVYLTADSPNTIDTLEEGTVYVIGGLVDKNRYPGLCFKKAQDLGLRHGKLPIGEHLQMSTRKVLTINHVFEIMLKYLATKDWLQAFLAVMPARKGGQAKPEPEPEPEPASADAEPSSNSNGSGSGGGIAAFDVQANADREEEEEDEAVESEHLT
ncbi:guanine-1-methyltransferase-domain-containing protein [Geranomyces variabilis]|nr:guanine-1-methyltransferase-domain-containing protein [Geranomyces variabilis]KAJ3131486.1 tRNA methyltransferase 10 [Geranomyces variabilis]